MALDNAERQRRYRQRLKERASAAQQGLSQFTEQQLLRELARRGHRLGALAEVEMPSRNLRDLSDYELTMEMRRRKAAARPVTEWMQAPIEEIRRREQEQRRSLSKAVIERLRATCRPDDRRMRSLASAAGVNVAVVSEIMRSGSLPPHLHPKQQDRVLDLLSQAMDRI